ncbi:MAG TPA: ATP-binding protein [Gemmatimonadaceae bacterium]|jgi:signal transduction histidine kinase
MTKRELGPTVTGTTPREQRLAAAGRVAAGLMHEFRNVLMPIANAAFVLEQQAEDPAKVRELARRLAQMAQVRGRVLDRLRDFLRQDAERFPDDAVVDLSAAVRETVALCTTLAASQPNAAPRFACEAVAELPVAGDGNDLRTAVFELLLNAMEATPAGGVIRVRTWSDGDRAVLEVRDAGAGLTEGMAEVAFDPFISSKGELDAGLGLSAAWGIARRHNGELTLGTVVSGGAVAVLSLPRFAAVR